MSPTDHPPVVLFGYDCEYDELGEGGVERMCLGANGNVASPFTNKVRLALRVKGVPFCKLFDFIFSVHDRVS
jgi:hypothetical protein